MKAARQRALRRLLEEDEPRTQRELMLLLAEDGFEVTQATVSRDLRELGAARIRIPSGGAAYTLDAGGRAAVPPLDVLRRRLAGSVESVGTSGDMVVVKTSPGHAQFVASAIDAAGVSDVIGTVGGDDTILVVARARKGRKVSDLIQKLSEMGTEHG